MADMLRIGLSALIAQQRALASTSNNIANANTAGYSRQRVELNSRPSERLGNDYVGTGTYVGGVRRLTDEFVATQVRMASTEFHRSDAFASLAASLDNLLADQQTGLSNTLQSFSNALQAVADDPASASSRQVFLSEARNLVARFESLDRRLEDVAGELNARTTAAAAEITNLGANIADVNRQILSSGTAAGAPPELLDQRDRLLARLAELVKVEAVEQRDGALNVFIGSGQALVLGATSAELAVTPSPFSADEVEVVLRGNGPDVTITQFLSGGEIGGALDFRREMLAPARANLGRIALALTDTFNTLHRNGMDRGGALGADFFAVPAPQALPASTNTGTAAASVSVVDLSGVQATRYELTYNGSAYQLARADNGAAVTMTGSGTVLDPFLADGLALVLSGAPASGDRISIRAVDDVPGNLRLLVTDADRIAAAAPTRTRAALANTGGAEISAGTVVDVTDPGLLNTTTIQFLTANTYSVNGGGSFAYTPGAAIDLNGTRVQISGAPNVGDQFVIESNAGGVGDNRNALALIGGLGAGILDGGRTTLQGSVAKLVTDVGAQTAETLNSRDAKGLLLEQSRQKLDSVRGVNLDEEAADLLRYEQLYQAAAQTIAVADGLFTSLLNALRG
jgi:flagellar hook-associated protein 1 FlgK